MTVVNRNDMIIKRYSLKLYIFIILFLIIFIASNYKTSISKESCTNVIIPKLLLHEIKNVYPNWHILNLKDIGDDSRKFIKENKREKCFAISKGHFKSKDIISHAILLCKNNPPLKPIMLISATKTTSGYHFEKILEDSSPQDMIIKSLPPGYYYNWEYNEAPQEEKESLSIYLPKDSILLEHMESYSEIVYFEKGDWQSFSLTE